MITLFENNFLDIRNKHINPLISYSTSLSKYEFWGFKDNLVQKAHLIRNNSKNNITFIVSDDIILNATLYDIELWLNKVVIQFCNYEKLYLKWTWSIVSLYYLNFYLLNLLSVITWDGHFYLDDDTCREIELYYNILNNSIIKLDPWNYHFKVQRIKDVNWLDTNEFNVNINKSPWTTHQTAWFLFDIHLANFLTNSSWDEKVVLQKLKDINNFYKPGFQSELRNELNYPSKSSMHDFSGKLNIPILGIYKGNEEKFFRDLVYFTPTDSYQSKIQGLTFYSIYLLNLTFLLYNEYLVRNKSLKSFHKSRQEFLFKNSITLPEF